jgi:hypothetical protein
MVVEHLYNVVTSKQREWDASMEALELLALLKAKSSNEYKKT